MVCFLTFQNRTLARLYNCIGKRPISGAGTPDIGLTARHDWSVISWLVPTIPFLPQRNGDRFPDVMVSTKSLHARDSGQHGQGGYFHSGLTIAGISEFR